MCLNHISCSWISCTNLFCLYVFIVTEAAELKPQVFHDYPALISRKGDREKNEGFFHGQGRKLCSRSILYPKEYRNTAFLLDENCLLETLCKSFLLRNYLNGKLFWSQIETTLKKRRSVSLSPSSSSYFSGVKFKAHH